MRRIDDLDYSNTPEVREATKILIKSLLRKIYFPFILKLRQLRVSINFFIRRAQILNKTQKKNTNIPKIIHFIWVGGNPKPESVHKYIESWRKYCPDYLIVEWNEYNYDISKNRYTREAYESKKWAFATDYMRLDILDQFGGIYLDSDVEILKNLDKFLHHDAFTSFEAGDESQVLMPTGLIASTASNPWIQYLKSYYDNERPFILADGSFDLNANTVTITRMSQEMYDLKMNNKYQDFAHLTIYPSEYFCPKSWSTGKLKITNNSHTIHHFAGSWK